MAQNTDYTKCNGYFNIDTYKTIHFLTYSPNTRNYIFANNETLLKCKKQELFCRLKDLMKQTRPSSFFQESLSEKDAPIVWGNVNLKEIRKMLKNFRK
jgi:hypothetical protein